MPFEFPQGSLRSYKYFPPKTEQPFAVLASTFRPLPLVLGLSLALAQSAISANVELSCRMPNRTLNPSSPPLLCTPDPPPAAYAIEKEGEHYTFSKPKVTSPVKAMKLKISDSRDYLANPGTGVTIKAPFGYNEIEFSSGPIDRHRISETVYEFELLAPAGNSNINLTNGSMGRAHLEVGEGSDWVTFKDVDFLDIDQPDRAIVELGNGDNRFTVSSTKSTYVGAYGEKALHVGTGKDRITVTDHGFLQNFTDDGNDLILTVDRQGLIGGRKHPNDSDQTFSYLANLRVGSGQKTIKIDRWSVVHGILVDNENWHPNSSIIVDNNSNFIGAHLYYVWPMDVKIDHNSGIDHLRFDFGQANISVKNGSSLGGLDVGDHIRVGYNAKVNVTSAYDNKNQGYNYLGSLRLAAGDDTITETDTLHQPGAWLDLGEGNNTLHMTQTVDVANGKAYFDHFGSPFFTHIQAGSGVDEVYLVGEENPMSIQPVLTALKVHTLQGISTLNLGDGDNRLQINGGTLVVANTEQPRSEAHAETLWTRGIEMGDGNDTFTMTSGVVYTQGFNMGAGMNAFTLSGGTLYVADQLAGEKAGLTFLGGGAFNVVKARDERPVLDVHTLRFDDHPVSMTVDGGRIQNTTATTPASITFGEADDELTLRVGTIDLSSQPDYVAKRPRFPLETDSVPSNETASTEAGVIDLGEGNNLFNADSGTVNAHLRAGAGNDTVKLYVTSLSTPTQTGPVLSLGDGNNRLRAEISSIYGDITMGSGTDEIALSGIHMPEMYPASIIKGNVQTGAGNDTSSLNSISYTGHFDMGDDDDQLTLNREVAFGAGTLLDGGRGTDTLITRQDLLAGHEATSVEGAVALTRWENLQVDGSSHLTWVSRSIESNVKLGPSAHLSFDTQGAVAKDLNIVGHLKSQGTIHLDSNGIPGDQLIISGDYEDLSWSELHLNSAWNESEAIDGDFVTDTLIVNGSARGKTIVHTISASGERDLIDGDMKQRNYAIRSKPVVRVKTPIANQDPAFKGTAKSAGIADYELIRLVHDGVEDYVWSAEAIAGQNEPRPDEQPVSPPNDAKRPPHKVPKDPNREPPATDPGHGVLILSPAVAGYASMPSVNLDAGFDALASYRERWGQKDELTQGDDSHRAYVRILSAQKKGSGEERLDNHTRTTGVEISTALRNHTHGDVRSQTALRLGYREGKSDFADRLRVEDGRVVGKREVSEGKATQYTLGFAQTFMFPSGTYLDFVAQASRLKNDFKAIDGLKATQRGWGAGLSAEVGVPVNLMATGHGALTLEPQAQLAYQRLWLDRFNDGIHDVKTGSRHALEARLGSRLIYSNTATSNAGFVTANLHQRWVNTNTIEVGETAWSEAFNDRWVTLGLGMNWTLPVGSLYGEAHYERGLDGEKRTGWRGELGWRVTF